MLSLIIPAYKEPYLQQMIDSIFASAEGEIEVIAVEDGYWANPQLRNDSRLRIVHSGKSRGMRDAINAGVLVSKGEYIMRADSHCVFDKGFDSTLVEHLEDNWIVTPRRYFLNPVKWEVMDLPPVDYEKLKIINYGKGQKFAGVPWKSRTKNRKDIIIDETMAMQGSCWIMKRSWWDKVIGELQTEGYGPLIQDSHEMVFKTWKAGGKLMVNKNTWFAHKHRSFPRTHNNGTKESPANCEQGYKYALDTWKDYFLNEIKPKWKI